METHTQEKPIFNCTECNYTCDNKRNLTDHTIAHSSDKIFTCTKCDYRTISNVSLSKHNREYGHGENYKCMDCDSVFHFANALTKHANEIHKNRGPFACSNCQKLFSNKSNLTRHIKIHITNNVTDNNENEKCSDNKNEEFLEFHTENKQCDDNNNNIEEISPEILVSNNDSDLVDKSKKICVSCKKNVKLKKLWGKYIIDDRMSFALNDYICELALTRWELSWDNSHARICLSCKVNLVSGKHYSSQSKKRGRPKVKPIGFVTVCSNCHTEVRRTNKKHICTIRSTKRNVKKIIDNSAINSRLMPKVDEPIFSVNADDLNIHQSISRLSSRQMHKQKKLWKSHLKDQGFKVKIAGQNKMDKLRKERIDDLFVVEEIRGNVGTEKNPIFKNINVVYCNNICELAKRIAKNRNTILETCKLQGDHGQGSLKLSIQFDFSNSVNTLIILAITEDSKESILTLKEIERLVNPQSLVENLGMTVLRTGDLQYLQLSIGIKTGNAAYPCPFCNWRMTGGNRDAVDAVCAPRNINKDFENFCRLNSNRNLSHRFHGQQGEPAFLGDPREVVVPPTLHINLGLVNHILEKMERKHTEPVVQKELYDKAKVSKTTYQGGKFEGNEIQKIVKSFNMISWPEDHSFKEYEKLFHALETTNEFVFSIKTELTDDDLANIAISIREVVFQWDCLKDSLCLSETVKLHVYAVHCLEFTIKHKCTPATYSEQDGEMLHRRFKQTLEAYKTLGKKALLYAVKMWNYWNY